MCGILGAMPSPVSENLFVSALNSLKHRGPDGYGIWRDSNNQITLGHRRLNILDLSDSGSQPMHYQKYVITYNGEIFNFIEIRKELEGKGYQFLSECDTEVILASFMEWGEKCLLKFNGMWAFAIWDKVDQKLFLARDRFGIKPIFYHFKDNNFYFASEMKALFPFLPEIRPSKDFEWCRDNIFLYENTEKCLIEGIKRFPAGHYGIFDFTKQQLKLNKYWNTLVHLQTPPKTYKEQVEKFREIFFDSCKIRMRADVPIGTTLSGGLDSSAIACAMSFMNKNNNSDRISKDWQHAFVAAFPGTFIDEREYAEKLIKQLKIKGVILPIDATKGIEKLDEHLYLFEELYLTSPIPMMDIYKTVRSNGVIVSIDGHGADELLAGYGKDVYRAFFDCGLEFSEIKNILETYRELRKISSIQLENERYDYLGYIKYLWNNHYGKRNLFPFIKRIVIKDQEKPSEGKLGFFNSYLYQIFHHTILPTLLRNYDRYSMASGVEVRMPFMDHRLVSYSFSLPWQSKLKGGYTKTILRDALKDILPEEVYSRKTKIGFNTPIVDWMKGPWKEFLLDTIASQDFKQSTIINPEEVEQGISNVINKPNATFKEGENAWMKLNPYLWEKAIIRKKIFV